MHLLFLLVVLCICCFLLVVSRSCCAFALFCCVLYAAPELPLGDNKDLINENFFAAHLHLGEIKIFTTFLLLQQHIRRLRSLGLISTSSI